MPIQRFREGQRFIILDNGDIEFDTSAAQLHNELPTYRQGTYVIHGHIYPREKILEFVDISFPLTDADRDGSYLDRQSQQQKIRKNILANLQYTLAPSFRKMIKEGIIQSDWRVESPMAGFGGKDRRFTVVDALSSTGGEEGNDDEYQKSRDEMGKKIIADYKARNDNSKKFYKNKDDNPGAWFGRYGENTEFLKFLKKNIFKEAEQPKGSTNGPNERFCAWCDRRIDAQDNPVGPVLPKSEQKGTHTACKECLAKILADNT